MEGSECELVETAFSDNSALGKESIAELLDDVIPLRVLNLVAGFFYVGPASLHIEGLVEGKLLVHHPIRVVCPHVVEAVRGQIRSAFVHVTIAHVLI